MADGATKKNIILRSSEGVEFKVTKKVAMMIKMIQHAIEDDCADIPIIPLPNVQTDILSLVLEYCTKHATETKTTEDGAVEATTAKMSDEELKAWDKNLIDVNGNLLYDILVAAQFLSIDGLVHLVCEKVADIIRTKSLDEIRHTLNMESDFSPEEEEEMRSKYSWDLDR